MMASLYNVSSCNLLVIMELLLLHLIHSLVMINDNKENQFGFDLIV
jgi:hypothetical protein